MARARKQKEQIDSISSTENLQSEMESGPRDQPPAEMSDEFATEQSSAKHWAKAPNPFPSIGYYLQDICLRTNQSDWIWTGQRTFLSIDSPFSLLSFCASRSTRPKQRAFVLRASVDQTDASKEPRQNRTKPYAGAGQVLLTGSVIGGRSQKWPGRAFKPRGLYDLPGLGCVWPNRLATAQNVVEISFDPFAQDEAVVSREFACVIATPQDQVIGFRDDRQFNRSFALGHATSLHSVQKVYFPISFFVPFGKEERKQAVKL
jgi:hypothetical protein